MQVDALLFEGAPEAFDADVICPRRLDHLKLAFSDTIPRLGDERNHMKASKFLAAQKTLVIKQGEEGTPVAGICCKAGISQTTHFNGKRKYAGLLPHEMKRLKQLEDENSQLKKIAADLTLEREMLCGTSSGERSEA